MWKSSSYHGDWRAFKVHLVSSLTNRYDNISLRFAVYSLIHVQEPESRWYQGELQIISYRVIDLVRGRMVPNLPKMHSGMAYDENECFPPLSECIILRGSQEPGLCTQFAMDLNASKLYVQLREMLINSLQRGQISSKCSIEISPCKNK